HYPGARGGVPAHPLDRPLRLRGAEPRPRRLAALLAALDGHRHLRPRPAHPGDVGRAHVTDGGFRRHRRGPRHRRAVGHGGGLRRGQARRGDDAPGGYPLRPALHDLHHPVDGGVRPQHHPAVSRHRRGGMAHHGPHRAGSGAEPAAPGIHRGGAIPGPVPLAHHPQAPDPNTLGPVIVYTTLTIPSVMLLEAFLSFLGLGVQPPESSWGSLISDGVESMEEYPWLLIFPALTLSITLFALNFLGDGLRDALDPRASGD